MDQKGDEGRRVDGVPADLNQGLKLFSNRLCPYAHRAWWTALEKEAPIDYIHIGIASEQPEWYAQVNPAKTVPCLYDNGVRIPESMVIAEYLEDKYANQGTKLLPIDPLARTKVREFLYWYQDQGPASSLYGLLYNKNPIEDKKLLAEAQESWQAVARRYEAASAGPFFLGSELSLADIMIVPFIVRFSIALPHFRHVDPFPQRLKSLLEACHARPAFAKTVQPAEPYIKIYEAYGSRPRKINHTHEIRFHHIPVGTPTEDIMEMSESEIPELKEGEVLVKSSFISLDPYMRGRMRDGSRKSYSPPFVVGEPLNGGVTAVVVKSNAPSLKEGDVVVGHLPWRRYHVASATALQRVDASKVPASYYLGVLGMPGCSAFLPIKHIAKPQPGEIAYVSGAAGAVGSVVGQILKVMGCTVIGSAGSDAKVEHLKKIGFDAAFNYKTTSVSEGLKAFAPGGIDIYWDNVGGPALDDVLVAMKVFGRIVVCGMISQYNAAPSALYGVKNIMLVLTKQLLVQGFIVSRWTSEYPEAIAQLAAWVEEGKIQVEETVVEGFEKTPAAFVGLFQGDNTGKLVIKVD